MPNRYTFFFLETYPKKLIKRMRNKAKKIGFKILKKGLYFGSEKIKIKSLKEIFDLVNEPFINENYAFELYGGVGELGETRKFKAPGGKEIDVYAPPPRKKLGSKFANIQNFLTASYEAKAANLQGREAPPIPDFKQPVDEDIPNAPPPPPSAPSMSRQPQQQMQQMMPMQQYSMAPMRQGNMIDELKNYKDSIEYIRSICPLLRREYNKKQKEGPKNKTYSKAVSKAMKRMEEMDRRILMRK